MLAMAYVLHGPHKGNLYDEELDVQPQIIPWLMKDYFSTKDEGTQQSAEYVALMQSENAMKHTFVPMDLLLRACPMFVLLCPQIVTLISQEDEISRSSSSEYHAEIVHRTIMQRMSDTLVADPFFSSTAWNHQWLSNTRNTVLGGFRFRVEAEVYLSGDGTVRTAYKFRPGVLDHFYVDHYEDTAQSLEAYMCHYVSSAQLSRIIPTKMCTAKLRDLEEFDDAVHVLITRRGVNGRFNVQLLYGSTYHETRYDLEQLVERIHDLRRLDALIAKAAFLKSNHTELDDDDIQALCQLYDMYCELEVFRPQYTEISSFVFNNLKKDCGGSFASDDRFDPVGVAFKPSGHGVYRSFWDLYTSYNLYLYGCEFKVMGDEFEKLGHSAQANKKRRTKKAHGKRLTSCESNSTKINYPLTVIKNSTF